MQVVIPPTRPTPSTGRPKLRARAWPRTSCSLYATKIAGDRGRAHVVIDDDPALAIVHATEEHDIDVLEVGNARIRAQVFLLGNVPNRISHNARCTVIIVNTTGDGQTATVERRGDDDPFERGRDRDRAAPDRPRHEDRDGLRQARLKELFGRPGGSDGSAGRRRQAVRLRQSSRSSARRSRRSARSCPRDRTCCSESIEELVTLQDNVPPLTEEQVVKVMAAGTRRAVGGRLRDHRSAAARGRDDRTVH